MKFFDPKVDIAFKKLFGSEDHKRVTIAFLNTILEYTGDRCIVKIHFMNNEQLPMGLEKKENILDIFCTDQSGKQYIIEMQNAWEPMFAKRMLWYGAKTYAEQLNEAKPYKDLNPVIVIAITKDFKIFPKKLGYKSIHKLIDIKTDEHDLEDFTFAFIELAKFGKQEHELVTNEDKWLFLLKNIVMYDHIPSPLKQAEFGEACQSLNRMTWSNAANTLYEKMLIKAQSAEAVAHLAMGAETARSEGEQKGREEGRLEVAKNLLSTGMEAKAVAHVTGLSLDQIKSLKT